MKAEKLFDIEMQIAKGVTHGEKPVDIVYEQLKIIHEYTGRIAERHPLDPNCIILHDGIADENSFGSALKIPILGTKEECRQWCKKHLSIKSSQIKEGEPK